MVLRKAEIGISGDVQPAGFWTFIKNIAAIRHATEEMTSKLWSEYEELKKDVNDSNLTLSKIKAEVMG